MDTKGKGRRGQAAKHMPRQSWYPLVGMEEPRRESDAMSLYRCGIPDIWHRHIIPPAEELNRRRSFKGKKPIRGAAFEVLWLGWTVGDTMVTLATIALLWAIVWVVGIGIDGYLVSVGL